MPSTSSLVSAIKSSDSGLRALLHPLVLLSVSDYITRHTLQRQTQPIAGAILGQQNGREISLEFAYEVKLIQAEGGSGAWTLDDDWFEERLAQYKLVHKSPALDLVGWWTISGVEGPGREILGIHERIMAAHNESALLLAFHPSLVLSTNTADAALPLTIYETVYENRKAESSGDMVVDGEQLELRLKELPCEVVSAEAEMISVDYVARGGGIATAVDPNNKELSSAQAGSQSSPTKQQANGKTRANTKGNESAKVEDECGLTAEDEELIASLTTRANATRMLSNRLTTLTAFLKQQSSASASSLPQPPDPQNPNFPVDHQLLRSIQALTARIPLLHPADHESSHSAAHAEKSDVALVALLASLGQNLKDAKTLGGKFAVVEHGRAGAKKGLGGLLGRMPGGGTFMIGMGEEGMGDGRDEMMVWNR